VANQEAHGFLRDDFEDLHLVASSRQRRPAEEVGEWKQIACNMGKPDLSVGLFAEADTIQKARIL